MDYLKRLRRRFIGEGEHFFHGLHFDQSAQRYDIFFKENKHKAVLLPDENRPHFFIVLMEFHKVLRKFDDIADAGDAFRICKLDAVELQ